ncbi:MAG: protein translocase subunit SecD [bacterium]|nr:protein translocase subunit SecD [bacterium]
MFKSFTLRATIVGIVTLASIIFLTPTLTSKLPAWWKGVLPEDKIHLGLDLKGGIHLVLSVETEKAIESTLDGIGSDIRQLVKKAGINYLEIERRGEEVVILLPDQAAANKTQKDILDKSYPRLALTPVVKEGGEVEIHLAISAKEMAEIRDYSVRQGVETIRNRVDQFGVAEPVIVREGDDRILIQLPGINDPKRAKELIGRTARLEFKMVDENSLTGEKLWALVGQAETEKPGISDDPEALNKWLTGKIPEDRMVLFQKVRDAETGRTRSEPFLLQSATVLSGDALRDAAVRMDRQYGTPYVSITLNAMGARTFEQVTSENVKRRLAIILDNNVHSAPVIQERIPGGQASITGRFSMEEATDLAIVLRAGALPAPVKVEEERVVGPSLGKDSIRRGEVAMAIGTGLVFIFMLIYYRFGGVIANLALIFNVFFILGALAGFKATLTFPGIAGIILTIGMAVDANILIYERMREEIRLGKTPRAVVEAGFERATATIMDANLTTLIAGLVLFQFGTGPVKGFAITLSIGIITTLFTALIICRLIFDYLFTRGAMKKLYL